MSSTLREIDKLGNENMHGPSNAPQAEQQGPPEVGTSEPGIIAHAPVQGHQLLNLPERLRQCPQWALAGPEGAPYLPGANGPYRIGVHDSPLLDFETAASEAQRLGWLIGIILRAGKGVTCIDLDVKDSENAPGKEHLWTTPEDIQLYAHLVEYFDSYTERSRSGKGLHIWVGGELGRGARKRGIEVYSQERFIICTGDVYVDTPIAERQEHIDQLTSRLRSDDDNVDDFVLTEVEETRTDAEVVGRAMNASNAEKFNGLCRGEWEEMGYPSQSEADMALLSILAFYTESNEQVRRIFRMSKLGNRDKATKDNKYIDGTLTHIRVRQAKEATSRTNGTNVPTAFDAPAPISALEWHSARLTPRCIVEASIFEDVGVFIAPGGMGKTTLVLYQAICIALGKEVFGYKVINPGPVVILTAEDSREMLVARLRRVAFDMNLTGEEVERVRSSVLIADVSGEGFKLTTVYEDVVLPHSNVDRMITALGSINPVVLYVDPAVSFGVGESRVNDAEQALVEAARRIRNELGCAVMYVHHTGKQNARGGTVDQYSGRGGSAFADGCRMVHVLQSLDPERWYKDTGDELEPGQTGLLLARPKISHAPPQPHIYIKRIGYSFTRIDPEVCESVTDRNADRVLAVLREELGAGNRHSGRSLESVARESLKLTQTAYRDAIARLKAAGHVVDAEEPNSSGRGGRRTYLSPAIDHEIPQEAGADDD